MKFVHMADTHLGRTGFHKVSPDGENLMAKQIYEHFITNIEKIVEMSPDFVIHSGDLFDAVKPQNKAFVVAAEGLQLLIDADIPMYCIAGNHSMTKVKYTSSPFEILRKIAPGNQFVYQFKPMTLRDGDCRIHLIPNMHHKEEYIQAHHEIEPEQGKYNILVMHGLCHGIKNKRLNTMAEIEIGDEITTDDQFQYVALGHYHNQEKIAPHIWYAGSMEYLTYGEINDTKGALLVDTEKGVTPLTDLAYTPMVSGTPITCTDVSPSEITDNILNQISHWDDMSMGQIVLKNIGPEKASALDHTHINEQANRLLHLKLKREDMRVDKPVPDRSEDIKSINYEEEFRNYVTSLGLSHDEIQTVSSKGTQVIKSVLGIS